MKIKILFFILLLSNVAKSQQKLYTKNGSITFTSKAPVQTIEAVNNKGRTILEWSGIKQSAIYSYRCLKNTCVITLLCGEA